MDRPPSRSNDDLPPELDTNRDGVIDEKDGISSIPIPPKESSGEYVPPSRYGSDDYTTGPFYNNRHPNVDPYPSYDTQPISSDIPGEVIRTRNREETQAILERTPNLYRDPNPEIIRRTVDCPTNYQQRVFLRCLEPPVQEPGPIIVKQVRPPPAPPLPPLIIREEGTVGRAPRCIVLRERPPPPPPRSQPEIKICHLPPSPPPPRAVIIERYPSLPDRPADVVIERWLPYRFSGERRRIVEPPPPATRYPEPRNRIICLQCTPGVPTRRFHNLGVLPANPVDYVARYGSSLLDRATLEQRARELGVVEDISCDTRLSPKPSTAAPVNYDYDTYSPVVNRPYLPPTTDDCGDILRGAYSSGYNRGSTYYPPSYKYLDRSSSCGDIFRTYRGNYI